MVILLLPLIQGHMQKFVHKVLVYHLVKLAKEKCVARQTKHLDMNIAVDLNIKP